MVLASCFVLSVIPTSSSYGAEKVGSPAPHLVIKPLRGTEFDLNVQKSKVIIVHFWATWCPPCRKEMSILSEIYQQYRARGIEMIALSVDRPRELDAVREAARDWTFAVAMLSDATTNEFGTPASLPMTYIIDQKGLIRQIFTSDGTELSKSSLGHVLDTLLSKQR